MSERFYVTPGFSLSVGSDRTVYVHGGGNSVGVEYGDMLWRFLFTLLKQAEIRTLRQHHIEGTVTDPATAAASQLAMSEQEVRENSQISDLLTGEPKSRNTEDKRGTGDFVFWNIGSTEGEGREG